LITWFFFIQTESFAVESFYLSLLFKKKIDVMKLKGRYGIKSLLKSKEVSFGRYSELRICIYTTYIFLKQIFIYKIIKLVSNKNKIRLILLKLRIFSTQNHNTKDCWNKFKGHSLININSESIIKMKQPKNIWRKCCCRCSWRQRRYRGRRRSSSARCPRGSSCVHHSLRENLVVHNHKRRVQHFL